MKQTDRDRISTRQLNRLRRRILRVYGTARREMTEQLTEQFMGKKPARGIRMDIQDGEITLDVYLTVKYGFAIPETAAKVQDAVMSAVETMTGFSVRAVNVHVGGISFN